MSEPRLALPKAPEDWPDEVRDAWEAAQGVYADRPDLGITSAEAGRAVPMMDRDRRISAIGVLASLQTGVLDPTVDGYLRSRSIEELDALFESLKRDTERQLLDVVKMIVGGNGDLPVKSLVNSDPQEAAVMSLNSLLAKERDAES